MSKPKIIAVPPAVVDHCEPCYMGRTYGDSCIARIKDLGLGVDACCTPLDAPGPIRHLRIFIEDTPEGRAAYIAEKLERANEPTR